MGEKRMFGKILYISDTKAYIENKGSEYLANDLLNIHLVFENNAQKILGEITEIREKEIEVKFLGEFTGNQYRQGVIRKASFNDKVRIINQGELLLLIGTESAKSFLLGESATYKGFKVYPNINDLFSKHLAIFGNSGSGKSCGVARIIQNILENKNSLAYNANFIFFDAYGEYKNAFKNIDTINGFYSYKFITSKLRDETDETIKIPCSLLNVDDLAVLLQADKHTQLVVLERAIKYAKLFNLDTKEASDTKNKIIARALLTVLFSQDSAKQKKDKVFSIIDACHTNEFNFDTTINGVGYTRTFSECFDIDSKGRFVEEVLMNEYILKFVDDKEEDIVTPNEAVFSLQGLSKALDFTLISEGFSESKVMFEDAQMLRVRLKNILSHPIGAFFNGEEYISKEKFITDLVSNKNKKAQIINISLENIDDAYAKAIVKIYSRIIFDFAKDNTSRATVPFHIFLEEAHRYIHNDNDVFLLGYNIFERIAKEGRKYAVILDIISQRPVELSDTVVSQVSNFLIFKMTHPKDIKYVEEMLPNISSDVIEKMKVLTPGTCVAFGSAFKIPMIIKLDMPSPKPYSDSCDISSYWDSKGAMNERYKEVRASENVDSSNITEEEQTSVNNIDML